MKDLRSFTPSICDTLGIDKPEFAKAEGYVDFGKKVSKAIIFCPDAFGNHAFKKRADLLVEMRKYSTHEVDLNSVFPPKTPVCFASLFTGGSPDQHGIKQYEKPVLKCETLFDSLVKSGKKTAIVAVRNSSIDILFKERDIDYFSMDYDPLVTAKAEELIRDNKHDVIIVYHQEYDDLLHDSGLFSTLALKALENHVDSWKFLIETAEASWGKDFLLAFTPDHGGHLDPKTNKGDHGLETPEDMELKHFFYLK